MEGMLLGGVAKESCLRKLLRKVAWKNLIRSLTGKIARLRCLRDLHGKDTQGKLVEKVAEENYSAKFL